MSWAETIRDELTARDHREATHLPVVQAYTRLAKHAAILSERNHALLAAANAPSSSSSTASRLTSTAGDNVRAALLTSLESQLTATKHELSEQYKIQASNAQRLLTLTDSLRDAEDRGREERDELRRLRSEVDGLRERARWHKEVVAEKEKQLLILQDDHASLELELSQVTIQNENLKIDNSSLLTRWIASKNEEAAKMNATLIDEAKALKVSSSSAKPSPSSSAPSDAGSDKGKKTAVAAASSSPIPGSKK